MVEALIAALCAALSGMGVGGGGLLLIYLTLFSDMAQRRAQFYNLLFFIAASLFSMPVHAVKRHIEPRVVALISLGGVAGSVAGSIFCRAAGDDLLGYFLGAFLFATGAFSFFGAGKNKRRGKSRGG